MAGISKTQGARVAQMTKPFDVTLLEQFQRSSEFRTLYLQESLSSMLNGEIDLGKLMLRKYVNGTIGFIALGQALGKSSKTLMQMLGPKGNPHIRNFFEIVAYLQKVEGTVLQVVQRAA